MTAERKEQPVLVIEDDNHVRRFAVHLLELEGYPVLFAADGPEGLRVAKAHSISLVLLDLRLPGLTGWEVLEAFKDDPELASIPVILFTAAASPEVRERAIRSGAAGFLAKPLTAHTLKDSVASVLGSRKQEPR